MPPHLHALLSAHLPQDEKEKNDLAQMRAWAEMLPKPFSRSQTSAHFTGSALVVNPSGTQVALVFHAKLKRWLQPGGHADEKDEGRMDITALREAQEETACHVRLFPHAPMPLDVDIHLIPARKDEPEHFHLDVRFLVLADNPEALAHDENESLGAKWVSWEEADSLVDDDSLRRLLDKGRRAIQVGR